MKMTIASEFRNELLESGIEKFRYQIGNLKRKVIVNRIKLERSGDTISIEQFHNKHLITTDSVELRDGWTLTLTGIEMLVEINLED